MLLAIDMLELIESCDDVRMSWELDPSEQILVIEDLFQKEVRPQLGMIRNELCFAQDFLDL